MRHRYFSDFTRLSILIILLLAVAWGCAPKKVAPRTVESLSTPNLILEADAAFEARQFETAELYYAKALERKDLSEQQILAIYPNLAQSAYENGHYHQARITLEDWANLRTEALESAVWERTYLNTMAALDKRKRLENHLKWVEGNSRIPWETRREVGLWYSYYFKTREDYGQSLAVLDAFYSQAPDVAARGQMEQDVAEQISGWQDSELDAFAQSVDADNQWRFPYVLVGFERGFRGADDAEAWSAIWRNLLSLTANADLVDVTPLQTRLAELEAKYGLPRIGLALALPVTGPYSKVGVKILRGAGLAQWRMAQDGVDIDLRVINTESEGWERRLAELPSHYTVVGGPLRVSAFKKLYETGEPGDRVIDQRAFFTFLSTLGDLEEGKDAWRFFTSRNDEVRSLVRLAVEELDIKDLAIFYPEEKFGRAMAETFYREAYPLGARIKGMQSYPPKSLKHWGQRVGKLLNVPSDFSENKDVPLEQPDFGAVFLPDGWNQAQTLLPNFFFYEGDQLVFLGPGLWSRALDNAKEIDEHYYRLAVCPGAWWGSSDGGRELQRALAEEGLGGADFWVALGYDFLRFAGKMGAMPASWDAEKVNDRIAKAQKIEFSMAPLTWDQQGVASQDLFLFSPARSGKQLVDSDRMTVRIERAKARREKRVEAYEKRMEEEKAKQEQNIF